MPVNRVALLAYRHSLVFTRRLAVNLCIYVLVPVITMYGLTRGFGLSEANARFMVPGFMVNAAAASAFMSTIYGSLIRLTMQGSYNSWLAATLTVHHVVLADVLWSVTRSTLVGLGVALGGCIVVGFFPWAAILMALPIVALTSTIAALLGLAIVSKARSFDDISIYEPILASIFVFSGVFAAASNFPQIIQWAMMFQPIYHGIHAVRPLFMGEALTWTPWFHTAILLVTAAAIYPLTYTLFKKRLIT